MNLFDPNSAFTALHEKFRTGSLSREDYDKKLRAMLILSGKLPGPTPIMARSFAVEAEHSGTVSYDWKPSGMLAISLRQPWDGHGRLNTFPRHVRQTARVELTDAMTDMEAVKLRVARAAGDAVFEAVMDDLLCCRAEEILQKQGPDAKRAVNLDERFHLGDNPDLIREEELDTLIDGTGRAALSDRER